MILKLYGITSLRSHSALVAMVLNEKKVPFEFVSIDMGSGEHKSPEYRAHNPFGQVPYIDDDGFILYESRAICRYISIKYEKQGTPLLPPADDIKAIALFEQAVSVKAMMFSPPAAGAISEMFYKTCVLVPIGLVKVLTKDRVLGLTPDQAIYDEYIAILSTRLDVYDEILGKQKYLAGDEMTLVDLFHLPGGLTLGRAGSDVMTQKPNVARWFRDISSRESRQSESIVTNAGKAVPRL
ncbi:thioredoxin-like protein [Infundibulicybe gibba]|nr:thioredoxin-like protein [Infundibulicybe gibba]KAF8881326.1 thioredoxin-like protein [Infundibulicybe gibba]